MSIKGGVRYITDNQLNSGSFPAYIMTEDVTTGEGNCQPVIIAGLLSIALHHVKGSEFITDKVADYLKRQSSTDLSWNYWDRTQETAIASPDRIDVSFASLSALWHHNQADFTPARMAHIARLLFKTETAVGGPYRMNIDEREDGVDITTNSAVGYFLSLQNVELPRLNHLFEQAIKHKSFDSLYYPPLQLAAYFLSQFYKGRNSESLKKIILDTQILGTWETPHCTALAVSSLLRLGYSPDQLEGAIAYLKASQQSDGSWPAGLVCLEAPNGRSIGCTSLTTAFCLEALSLYDEYRQQQTFPRPVDKKMELYYNTVVENVRQRIVTLEHKELCKHTKDMLHKMVGYDKKDKQIVLLPYMIERVAGVTADKTILKQLAEANLWGWISYTIYDDFLDNEGDPQLLPSALFTQRQLLKTLRSTLSDVSEFQQEIDEILDRLDGANAWEVAHCRGQLDGNILHSKQLPDYGNYWQLADRSIGHMIAALGVLYSVGMQRQNPSMEALRDFFFHYLIARQLNDDAHDWEEDLRQGHVNAAGVLILKKWESDRGKSVAVTGINLRGQKKKLRIIMWEYVIDIICEAIYDHIDQARAALERPGVEFEADILLDLLAPLKRAADKALATKDQTKEFNASL